MIRLRIRVLCAATLALVLMAQVASAQARPPATRGTDTARASRHAFALEPLGRDDGVALAMAAGVAGKLPPALHYGVLSPASGGRECEQPGRAALCAIGVVVHGPRYVIALATQQAIDAGRRLDYARQSEWVPADLVWFTVVVPSKYERAGASPDWWFALETHRESAGRRRRPGAWIATAELREVIPKAFHGPDWRIVSFGFRPDSIPAEDFDAVVSAGPHELRIAFPVHLHRWAAEHVR